MSDSKTLLGRGHVIRADVIPDFVRQAHGTLATAPVKAPAKKQAAAQPDSMSFAKARKVMALKFHGAGVYEDTKTGQVWWREGNVLKRRHMDRDRIVAEYLAECQAKEGRRTAQKKTAQVEAEIGDAAFTPPPSMPSNGRTYHQRKQRQKEDTALHARLSFLRSIPSMSAEEIDQLIANWDVDREVAFYLAKNPNITSEQLARLEKMPQIITSPDLLMKIMEKR